MKTKARINRLNTIYDLRKSGMTYLDIGKNYGFTKQRAFQMVEQAEKRQQQLQDLSVILSNKSAEEIFDVLKEVVLEIHI